VARAHEVAAIELGIARILVGRVPVAGAPQADFPVAVALFHVRHRGADEQLGAQRLRLGEIVHRQRVLGAEVASRHAVAAAHAALLLHALRVAPVGLEPDRDADRAGVKACCRCEFREAAEFRQIRGLGRLRAQHRARLCEHLAQLTDVALQRRRPLLVQEHVRLRRLDHAGVDERAAAQAVAHQRADILADAKVVQAIGAALDVGVVRARQAHVPGHFGDARREAARDVFGAALQHADSRRPAIRGAIGNPGARKARRRHGAAVAAADHDHVEMRLGRRRRI
jgi:hypothetical protein